MVNLSEYTVDQLLVKRRGLRRELSAAEHLQPVRIAVLGGTTTHEVVDLLELFLLAGGFRPTFRQSEYGRFYEDAVHNPEELVEFKPDVVYVHTSMLNIQEFPPIDCSEADLGGYVDRELGRYQRIWESLQQNLSCQIIQNNFELPANALLGNMDMVSSGGRSRFVLELNRAFAREANANPRLLIQDVFGLSSRMGLNQWISWERYFSYKLLVSPEGTLALARSLDSIVRALYGKSRKLLVLDLDNTLWGGVIGDDGADKIVIGRETPMAEAYTSFQEYCLALRARGVLLAVCSKNNEDVAKSGFEHPDSVLKLEHISCFKANWEPKHTNIEAIAKELNLGVDSFVFVDDNPAERAIVEAQIPGIAVPAVGSDVSAYAAIIDEGRYFEPVSLSAEDLERAALYQKNSQRAATESKFANYGEYLDSLEMVAEIEPFRGVYIDRIAQLTNKSNQFNLTTRRYTVAEMEAIATDNNYIGLYGKLSDRFGDNGLISVVLGRKDHGVLQLDLWLMSCRVLKRDMEIAMLDQVILYARKAGIHTLRGTYLRSKKNGMVEDHYQKLGFALEGKDDSGASYWTLDLDTYTLRNTHIRVLELVHG